MPVSGLVLTLSSDPARQADARRTLSEMPSIELGPRDGRRVAAVLDTVDEDANRCDWRRLNDLDGVEHIDVTFVSLDHDTDATRTEPAARTGEATLT